MSLTTKNIKNIASLARIRINEDEYEKVAMQLNSIFGWIDQLQKVGTEGVTPFKYINNESMPEQDDVAYDGNCVDLILKNAPEKAHNMFSVPKVIE